jgi:hypothetical protein
VAGGALAATLALRAANLLGLRLNGLLGLSAGGYLIFWFALAGVAGLLLLQGRLLLPARRELLGGLLIFAGLWLGVGLLGDMVWLPWLLIPERLALWPLAILALLPWSLLIGEAGRPADAWAGGCFRACCCSRRSPWPSASRRNWASSP